MSNTYYLNIAIDSASLTNIYESKQSIVIVQGDSINSGIAWVVFNPFELNTVSWQTSYTLYASQTQIQAGATISMLSQSTPAQNVYYDFNSAQFAATTTAAPQNGFGVNNQMPSLLTFGLAQSATVAGNALPSSPINATPVPPSNSATFTPVQTLTVFAQADISTSQVVGTVTSPSITVTYTNTSTARISMVNGQWIQTSDNAVAQVASNQLFSPGKLIRREAVYLEV